MMFSARFAYVPLSALVGFAAAASLQMRAAGWEAASGLGFAVALAVLIAGWRLAGGTSRVLDSKAVQRFAVTCAVLLVARTFVPAGPELDWRFHSLEGRPATRFVGSGWRDSGGVIELHASKAAAPGVWPDRLAAGLPATWFGSGLRLSLRVTQPEWVVLDEAGKPRESDGCEVVIRARSGAEWRTLRTDTLRLAGNSSERRWRDVSIDLSAQDQEVAIAVRSGRAEADNAYDRVWMAPRGCVRTFGWFGAGWLAAADAVLICGLAIAVGGFAAIREQRANPPSEVRSTAAPRAPLASRACELAIVGFALWSVCCHFTVMAGGSLHVLLLIFSVAAVLIGACVAVSARYGRRSSGDPSQTPNAGAGDSPSAGEPLSLGSLWPLGAVALMVPVLDAWGGGIVVWLGISGAVTVGLLMRRSGSASCRPRSAWPYDSSRERRLWALAAACVLIALTAHRPDPDDAYYVGAAAGVCANPSAPLLRDDLLHGVEGLPPHMPAARVQTLEVLNGAIAYVAGVPPILSFHWLTAGLAALFVPLAIARLCRILTPRDWLYAVLAAVCVLACAADTHRSFGNFGLVRIWQGKAIFLSVVLPLIYAYGMEFGLKPSLRRGLLLAAAQIAAIGCTSSALMQAPLAAIAGTLCTLRLDRRAFLALGGALLSSAYLVVAGLLLRTQLAEVLASIPPAREAGGELNAALDAVLGFGVFRGVALIAIAGCWCVSTGIARRWAAVVPLLGLLGPLNPWFAEAVARLMTGPAYWRAVWTVPIPLLIGLLLIAPLGVFRDRRWARVAAIGAICAFVLFVPRIRTLTAEDGVRWAAPGPKAPPLEYGWARRLSAVAAGEPVLAPEGISLWEPTFVDRAFPLVVRPIYMSLIRRKSGDADADRRQLLTALVDEGPISLPPAAETADAVGDSARAGVLLRDGIGRYDLSAICLSARAAYRAALEETLTQAGFTRCAADTNFELWVCENPAANREANR